MTSPFQEVLDRPDAISAVRLLQRLLVEANSAGYSSSALRSSLYDDFLVRILDRMHGEHKDWAVPIGAVCWWDAVDPVRIREFRDALERNDAAAVAAFAPGERERAEAAVTLQDLFQPSSGSRGSLFTDATSRLFPFRRELLPPTTQRLLEAAAHPGAPPQPLLLGSGSGLEAANEPLLALLLRRATARGTGGQTQLLGPPPPAPLALAPITPARPGPRSLTLASGAPSIARQTSGRGDGGGGGGGGPPCVQLGLGELLLLYLVNFPVSRSRRAGFVSFPIAFGGGMAPYGGGVLGVGGGVSSGGLSATLTTGVGAAHRIAAPTSFQPYGFGHHPSAPQQPPSSSLTAAGDIPFLLRPLGWSGLSDIANGRPFLDHLFSLCDATLLCTHAHSEHPASRLFLAAISSYWLLHNPPGLLPLRGGGGGAGRGYSLLVELQGGRGGAASSSSAALGSWEDAPMVPVLASTGRFGPSGVSTPSGRLFSAATPTAAGVLSFSRFAPSPAGSSSASSAAGDPFPDAGGFPSSLPLPLQYLPPTPEQLEALTLLLCLQLCDAHTPECVSGRQPWPQGSLHLAVMATVGAVLPSEAAATALLAARRLGSAGLAPAPPAYHPHTTTQPAPALSAHASAALCAASPPAAELRPAAQHTLLCLVQAAATAGGAAAATALQQGGPGAGTAAASVLSSAAALLLGSTQQGAQARLGPLSPGAVTLPWVWAALQRPLFTFCRIHAEFLPLGSAPSLYGALLDTWLVALAPWRARSRLKGYTLAVPPAARQFDWAGGALAALEGGGDGSGGGSGDAPSGGGGGALPSPLAAYRARPGDAALLSEAVRASAAYQRACGAGDCFAAQGAPGAGGGAAPDTSPAAASYAAAFHSPSSSPEPAPSPATPAPGSPFPGPPPWSDWEAWVPLHYPLYAVVLRGVLRALGGTAAPPPGAPSAPPCPGADFSDPGGLLLGALERLLDALEPRVGAALREASAVAAGALVQGEEGGPGPSGEAARQREAGVRARLLAGAGLLCGGLATGAPLLAGSPLSALFPAWAELAADAETVARRLEVAMEALALGGGAAAGHLGAGAEVWDALVSRMAGAEGEPGNSHRHHHDHDGSPATAGAAATVTPGRLQLALDRLCLLFELPLRPVGLLALAAKQAAARPPVAAPRARAAPADASVPPAGAAPANGYSLGIAVSFSGGAPRVTGVRDAAEAARCALGSALLSPLTAITAAGGLDALLLRALRAGGRAFAAALSALTGIHASPAETAVAGDALAPRRGGPSAAPAAAAFLSPQGRADLILGRARQAPASVATRALRLPPAARPLDRWESARLLAATAASSAALRSGWARCRRRAATAREGASSGGVGTDHVSAPVAAAITTPAPLRRRLAQTPAGGGGSEGGWLPAAGATAGPGTPGGPGVGGRLRARLEAAARVPPNPLRPLADVRLAGACVALLLLGVWAAGGGAAGGALALLLLAWLVAAAARAGEQGPSGSGGPAVTALVGLGEGAGVTGAGPRE